ncbi:MAG: methylene-tetrahydromethanopterin dehydrogenase N-terminal domain-containing protein [Gammaproteobacteria bacterium]
MKKLLFQFDTDPIANTFDTIVAYDGGADHVTVHGGLTPKNVGKMVDGAIFTRAPKSKRNTALFVTGSDMAEGEALLNAIRNHFFDDFRVSVMLDSNGSNTTAAAAVAFARQHVEIKGKRAVILAGTGPVGQRAGLMLAKEGADVVLTSRKLLRAKGACDAMRRTFGVDLHAAAASDNDWMNTVLEGANIVIATGAAGVPLISPHQWQNVDSLEVVIDANATPPLGIGGIEMSDRGKERHGKICYGALGFGGFKLEIQRACIAKLFETTENVFDALEIYQIAKEMKGIA